MLGINCIKLTFGYLNFSPKTFPKIQQKLGGQLEIRLSVYYINSIANMNISRCS